MAANKPPREDLVRASSSIGLTRNSNQDGMPTLTVTFPLGQWTEIRSAYEGNLMEQFAPGSFDKTIGENGTNTKVLFNHGKDPSVGAKVLGKPRAITPGPDGVTYDIDLFDAPYVRDLLPGIEAGAYGSSVQFSIVKEDWDPRPKRSEMNPRGIPTRIVREARVGEIGPVTFPAYQGSTAGLRSLTDHFLFNALTEDPERLKELIESRRHSRAFFASAPAAKVTYTINGVTEERTVMADETSVNVSYGEMERAVWDTAYVNDLPDSAFLYVEPGGKKDSDGKTVPRDLRHLPVRDASGSVDRGHLDAAVSRLSQENTGTSGGDSWLSDSLRATLLAKAKKLQSSGRSVEDGLLRSDNYGHLGQMMGLAQLHATEQPEHSEAMNQVIGILTELIDAPDYTEDEVDQDGDQAEDVQVTKRSRKTSEDSTAPSEPDRSGGTTRTNRANTTTTVSGLYIPKFEKESQWQLP